jgi:uncharacterized protein (TIGR02246 family)
VTRAELEDVVRRFTEAFNHEDLDEVMSYFAEHAVYEEFDGKRNVGIPAIRAAFEPQFRGDYGEIRFEIEDVFADADSGKALVRWTCVVARESGAHEWRGLDVLRFENRELVEKLTYAKAPKPLVSRR